MATLFTPATTPAESDAGVRLNAAHWYFYQTGTTVAATVYQDADLITPHTNPVVSDSVGRFDPIYMSDSVAYRAVLKDGADATTYQDIDPANPDASAVISAAAAASAAAASSASAAADSAAAAASSTSINVLASTLGFTPGQAIADLDFADSGAWTLGTGWTYSSDSHITTGLSSPLGLKTVAGDGTLVQAGTVTSQSLATYIPVQPSQYYSLRVPTRVPSGFAGRLRVRIQFYLQDGVTTTGSVNTKDGTDYRSVAAAAAATEVLTLVSQAPADAHFAQVSFMVNWPTAIASAGTGYFANPRFVLARQSHPGMVSIGPASSYTISSGVITLDGVSSNIVVDTEGAAATDDLDTINGGFDGAIVILQTANSSRDVTVKDGTGNINLPADVTLSTTADRLMLVSSGANWFGAAAFSDNQ